MSDYTSETKTKATRDHITNLIGGGNPKGTVGYNPIGHVKEAKHRKGSWKVKANEGIAAGAYTSKEAKEAQVPLRAGRHAEIVRLHESRHLARDEMTTTVAKLKRSRVKGICGPALHASEEIAVNGGLTRDKFVTRAEWPEVHKADGHPLGTIVELKADLVAAEAQFKATGVSSMLEEAKFRMGVRAAAGLQSDYQSVPDWANGLAMAGRALFNNPTFANQKLFHKEWGLVDERLRVKHEATKDAEAATEMLRVGSPGSRPGILSKAITEYVTETTRGVGAKPTGSDKTLGTPKPGHLTTRHLPLTDRTTKLGEGRRWKLTDEPSPMLKRPARLMRYGDRVAFRRRTPPTKGGMGSFLIDASGSMGWDTDALVELLKAIPKANIGVYAGRAHTGELYVVALKGMMAKPSVITKALESLGGNNVVDLPALDWLAKQPEPRVWVSDGFATEVNDGFTPRIVMACAKVCKQHNIKRFEKHEILNETVDS